MLRRRASSFISNANKSLFIRRPGTLPIRLLATAPGTTASQPSTKFNNTNKLDNKIEANLTKLSIALSNLPSSESSSPSVPPTSVTKPDPTNHTFHLPDDLSRMTTSDTLDLLEYFLKPPYNHTLHPYYFSQILKSATSILDSRSAINKIETEMLENTTITVIGDLHGSLSDLSSLLQTISPPSPTNIYLFNGDYVDRGLHSVEVLSIICCLLISSPDSVYLNRGNHEDTHVCKAYGFKAECNSKHLNWEECGKFFENLSLAHLIPREYNGGALVVHAGIGNCDWKEFCSISKGDGSILKSGILEDITWSDPDFTVSGIRSNEIRGAGSFYGGDVVERILEDCGRKHFVRSHEPRYNGVEHIELVDEKGFYTVFTATDYPNFEGCNLAGVLQFNKGGEKNGPEIITWESEELVMTSNDVNETGYDNGLTCMKSKLVEEIFLHKVALHDRLLLISEDKRRVTIQQWKECMIDVTGLDIDWAELEPFLAKRVQRVRMVDGVAKIEETGFIDINHFLEHFEDAEGGGLEGDQIFNRNKMLYVLFKDLDKDDSGGLSRSEFEIAVKTLNEHLGEGEKFDLNDVGGLFESLDRDGNGVIDLDEWKNLF